MTTRINRRALLTMSAAAALLPRTAFAQTPGPWSQRPSGTPGSVNFVVWQYGKIYEQIAKQFEDDWGVKVRQIIEPNVEPQVAKLTAMFAANEPVDVSQSPMQYLASYIEQGIAQRDGKTWGLPYFSTVWTFMYNDELLGKAGFKDKPFKSYPELVEQARKAKKDAMARASSSCRAPGSASPATAAASSSTSSWRRSSGRARWRGRRSSGGRARSRRSWPIRPR